MSNIDKNPAFEKIEFVKILRKKESPFLHNIQVIFELISDPTSRYFL